MIGENNMYGFEFNDKRWRKSRNDISSLRIWNARLSSIYCLLYLIFDTQVEAVSKLITTHSCQ